MTDDGSIFFFNFSQPFEIQFNVWLRVNGRELYRNLLYVCLRRLCVRLTVECVIIAYYTYYYTIRIMRKCVLLSFGKESLPWNLCSFALEARSRLCGWGYDSGRKYAYECTFFLRFLYFICLSSITWSKSNQFECAKRVRERIVKQKHVGWNEIQFRERVCEKKKEGRKCFFCPNPVQTHTNAYLTDRLHEWRHGSFKFGPSDLWTSFLFWTAFKISFSFLLCLFSWEFIAVVFFVLSARVK